MTKRFVSHALFASTLNVAVKTEEHLDAALFLIRRMAERFDRANNGRCDICWAGRESGGWSLDDDGDVSSVAASCSNERCLSHEIRSILKADR